MCLPLLTSSVYGLKLALNAKDTSTLAVQMASGFCGIMVACLFAAARAPMTGCGLELIEVRKFNWCCLQLMEDLEQLKVLENGYKIKVIVVEHEAHGVDEPEDVPKIEEKMRKLGLPSRAAALV